MPLLVEVSARVVLLVAGVALTLAALRIRSPRTAHRAWVGVALALIVLPFVIAWGPVVAIPVAADAPLGMTGHAVTTTAVPASADATPRAAVPAPVPSADAARWETVVLGLYLAGALVWLARIVVGVLQASALRRQARVVDGRLTSERCSTPITVGLRAPVVILPATWTSWPASELEAVLAHEREHARCRDPLATMVTLVARALFWFHPLAWWLPRHVARLAEQACDVAVLARGHDPDVYAAALVKFARVQARARGRIAAPGMAMGGLALESRLRLLQNPVRTETGSARLVAALAVYAFAVGLCCIGAPVAARAVDPGPQAQAAPSRQPHAGRWHAETTEHFEIYSADEQAHLVAEVARQAEEAYAELSVAFRYDLPERVPLVLVGGDVRLRDATVEVPIGFPIGATTTASGEATPTSLTCEIAASEQTLSGTCAAAGTQARRQVVVLAIESLDPQRRLIVHELTHRFAFDIVPEPSRVSPWLIEGLAEHHRGVWDAESVRGVRDAVAASWVPAFDALAGAERYWAHALFDFIADRHGAEGMRRYLFALRTRPHVAEAIPTAFGVSTAQFNAAFRRYINGRFGTL